MILPTPEGEGFYRTLALTERTGSGATLGGTDVSYLVAARLRMLIAALWSRLTAFVRLEFGPYPRELPNAHIIAVIKAALNALGDEVGDPLPPIQPIKGPGLEYVREVAQSLARLEESLPVVEQR